MIIEFKAICGDVYLGDELLKGEDRSIANGINCQEDFAEYSDLSDKLEHGYMHFIYVNNELFVYTIYKSKVDLSNEELDQLRQETQGQWSDGIGEGFEQNPCAYVENKELLVSPWFYGQKIECIVY